MDADYADDKAFLANALTQAESLLNCLKFAVDRIGLQCRQNRVCVLNQKEVISTLNGVFLKLADKFTYLVAAVLFTEYCINVRLTKAWTAIDWLSIIWKSKLSNKMKRKFLQVVVVSILL